MEKRIKSFDNFSKNITEATDYRDVLKKRKEIEDDKSINYMLKNALLFRRMKLTDEMEQLEKEKAKIIIERDADPYTANHDLETNPVLQEYEEKISNIDTKIEELKTKIEELKQ